MRNTEEIIRDLKDGKEPTYEELEMACYVQDALLQFRARKIWRLVELNKKGQRCGKDD